MPLEQTLKVGLKKALTMLEQSGEDSLAMEEENLDPIEHIRIK